MSPVRNPRKTKKTKKKVNNQQLVLDFFNDFRYITSITPEEKRLIQIQNEENFLEKLSDPKRRELFKRKIQEIREKRNKRQKILNKFNEFLNEFKAKNIDLKKLIGKQESFLIFKDYDINRAEANQSSSDIVKYLYAGKKSINDVIYFRVQIRYLKRKLAENKLPLKYKNILTLLGNLFLEVEKKCNFYQSLSDPKIMIKKINVEISKLNEDINFQSNKIPSDSADAREIEEFISELNSDIDKKKSEIKKINSLKNFRRDYSLKHDLEYYFKDKLFFLYSLTSFLKKRIK